MGGMRICLRRRDFIAVRAKLDRREGLQWLERAVAVKGADLFEADSRPTPMCAL